MGNRLVLQGIELISLYLEYLLWTRQILHKLIPYNYHCKVVLTNFGYLNFILFHIIGEFHFITSQIISQIWNFIAKSHSTEMNSFLHTNSMSVTNYPHQADQAVCGVP